MKFPVLTITRFIGFLITIFLWRSIQIAQFAQIVSYLLIFGSILLVFPVVYFGRKAIDANPTIIRLDWTTTIIHFTLMVLLGMSIIEAIKFFRDEHGIFIPVPVWLAVALLLFTGVLSLLTVVNLALSGMGAPFAIIQSRRIANRWMYRYTRNPMVLATLATLLSVGLYLQSLYFVLWVFLLVTPAWIYFLKVYEERELEIRFGTSYLDYKKRTSFLWPKKPKNRIL